MIKLSQPVSKVLMLTIIVLSVLLFTNMSKPVQAEKIPTRTADKIKIEPQPIWVQYKEDVDLYLTRFPDSPLTGDLLSKCARETFNEYDVMVPMELALAQAQFESSMGTKGKSNETNPYNVGEWDSGTMITFNNTEDGVLAYYDLIATKFLSNIKGEERKRDSTVTIEYFTIENLFKNFVSCNGHRYARSEQYENHISNQYYFIQRWVSKQN